MKQVAANVYIECGLHGCNLGIITTRDGIVMIDTPVRPRDAMRWREEINRRGEVRYLINTDQHPDHDSGNHFFRGICVAHKESRDALLSRRAEQVIERVKRTDPDALRFMEGYQVRLPDVTFTESLNIYEGDHSFELIHVPGHAPGVICVYIPEEHVVFASDCVFYKEKSYLHEATPHQWIESIKKLEALDADIIVPGHGDDVCNKGYLDEQASIIRQWVEAVETAIRQGLSADEAAARVHCPDPYVLPKQVPWSESELNRNIVHRLYHIFGH